MYDKNVINIYIYIYIKCKKKYNELYLLYDNLGNCDNLLCFINIIVFCNHNCVVQ